MLGGFTEVGIEFFLAQDTGRVKEGATPISGTWAMGSNS